MITCSQCGRENEAFFKFCLGCGAELVQLGGARPAPAPAPRQRSGRKTPDTVVQPATPTSEAAASETPAAPAPAAPAPVISPSEPMPSRAAPTPAPAPVHVAAAAPVIARRSEPTPAPTPAAVPHAEPRPQEERVCVTCGAFVLPGHQFCANCGTRYEARDRRPAAPRVEVRSEAPRHGRGRLVLIQPDQSDGESFVLFAGVTSFGRQGTDIAFPHDDFLAAHHLDIVVSDDRSIRVRPQNTLNGTFLRIRTAVPLADGDEFRIGQELLRLDLYDSNGAAHVAGGEPTLGGPLPGDVWGRLCVVVSRERVAHAFLLMSAEIQLGRDKGHITFPHDGYVSGRHAALVRRDGRPTIEDCGSRNGTYVRLKGEQALRSGDLLLAGQQLFRVQL